MRDLKIGDKVRLINNRAGSSFGRDAVGYITWIKTFTIHSDMDGRFTLEQVKKHEGCHYWVDYVNKERFEEPDGGRWSFPTDLEYIGVEVDKNTTVI